MNRRILGAAASAAAILAIATSSVASAHVVKSFGTYSIALGWLTEPTFTGEPNAVVAIVTDGAGKPVNDLGAGDLTVTVSAAGQTSASLPLNPSYDPDTGFGTPGLYFADVIPTQPGDYTFRLSGTVHGTAVDETATSSSTTFNAVEDPASVQFPVREPTIAELSGKVDRLDTRLQAAADAAASAATSASGAATTAQATAASASSQASQAMAVGVAVGGIGILVGLAGVVLALRARRAA